MDGIDNCAVAQHLVEEAKKDLSGLRIVRSLLSADSAIAYAINMSYKDHFSN